MTHDLADILVGFFYVIVCLHILILNLIVLYIIYSSKEMSSSAYRIMFQLGITGSLQVFFHAIGGFFSLANSSINPYFQMICGGILNAAWIAGIPFTLLLALNRILVICFTSRVGFWFSKRNTSLLIIVFWIYPVLFLIVYVTPFCNIRYNPQQFSWGYDDGPWSYVLSEAEFYSIIAMLVITAFCYIIIIIRLVLLRKKASHVSHSRHETSVLIQAIFIFGFNLLCLIAWHTYSYFLSDSRWTLFVVNTLWILNGAVNPVLYLTINGSIRKPFLAIVMCKKPITPVIPKTTSSVFVIVAGRARLLSH